MKKIIAMGMLGLWIGINPVQAQEIDILNNEAIVAYGIIPNPIKIITAPARAAKKKIDTVRKVAKVGKKVGKLGEGKSDEKDNGGDRADVIEKNKKQQDKEYEAWKKSRDQELETIAKEKAERERLRRELGLDPVEEPAQENVVKPVDKVEVKPAEGEPVKPAEAVKPADGEAAKPVEAEKPAGGESVKPVEAEKPAEATKPAQSEAAKPAETK